MLDPPVISCKFAAALWQASWSRYDQISGELGHVRYVLADSSIAIDIAAPRNIICYRSEKGF